MDSADVLFYERGINTVGVNELVEHAGVAKTSLYLHFSSKDELAAAYLQRRLDSGQADLDRRMERVRGAPAERIVALFKILSAWMAGPTFRGCPFINAAAEFPQADHPVHKVIAEHRTRTLARFRTLADDVGPPEDAEALAKSLMLLYDGALVAADLGSAKDAGRSVVATVRRLVGAEGGLPPR